MQAGERIPKPLLDRGVAGMNLVPGSLGDQLGSEIALLVFLRHLGCIFCRETLADLRQACEADPDFPRPLFFFQGRPFEGRALLRRYWPQARAIADPELELYEAFGLGHGGLVAMFRPAVWTAKRRAAAKGHENGPRSGDIWRMPGVFLARGDEILWAHEYRHAADHPDYARIRELAASFERETRA